MVSGIAEIHKDKIQTIVTIFSPENHICVILVFGGSTSEMELNKQEFFAFLDNIR